MGREALEITELEDGTPERLPYFPVELSWQLAGILANQIIDLCPKPETAENNLTSKARIARV
jgi:hypothetical protein